MSNKPNLATLLAESGGSARHPKAVIQQPATPANTTAPAQQGRAGTSPITVHFPKQVRDQLKILAVQKNKTLHSLVAEPSTTCLPSTVSPKSPRRRRHKQSGRLKTTTTISC
jgi:hypothetical protein